MYYTYILYSKSTDRYYVGYTSDISRRSEKHNHGNSGSTKSGIPGKFFIMKNIKQSSKQWRGNVRFLNSTCKCNSKSSL
ncbi:MAG: GIY-YIG nuclease family protein [Candidatus Marinimicrobia bacterium]|nr:GIY-YIG nuclease family protein [Candidatus Neomarinimicrobiota bacterium]